MFKKNLFLILVSAVLLNSPILAMEMLDMQDMQDMPEDMKMTDADVRSCKCKKFKCINVCGTAYANSFVTPSGALFNGLRNWAVLANQIQILSTKLIPWDATSAGNLSSGITVNSTGTITLPTSGIFLVQYTVRLNIDTSLDQDSQASIDLLQAGKIINQAAIQNNTTIITTAESNNIFQTQITGYGLVTVTSAANNTISLGATFNNGYTIPGITLPSNDANAQMTILQLN